MIFNFTSFNHCRQGQIIVEDITRLMGNQMVALGHEVTWENDQFLADVGGDRSVYNVVLESFADDPRTIQRIAAARAEGCRFIYVATELPTDSGFNHGLEPAMINRQNAFPDAAKYCDGILHLIPGEDVTRWYGQFAPAAHAELGYSDGSFNTTPDIEPDHDFGFYGKMTWRRREMIARLTERGHKVLVIDSLDVPRAERDTIMRRAKVILQIRANEEWGMVSSTRCASALCFGRPIIAEPHPFEKPWNEVIEFAETELFYDKAIDASRYWRKLHAQQFWRFKGRLTPERCIGDPLRKIGIIP